MEKIKKNKRRGGRGNVARRDPGSITILQRHFSAGGVVFKKENNQTLWLIAKSTPSVEYPVSKWRLPKGWLDDEEEGVPGPLTRGEQKAGENELREGALREVREEGGVESRIIEKIETTRFFFTTKKGERILKFVTYYLMEWVSDLLGGFGKETLEVKWLPYDGARETLSIRGEKIILDKAKDKFDSGVQDSLI